jgi:putative flippase GtrA
VTKNKIKVLRKEKMTTKPNNNLTSFKVDLSASVLIGLMAGLFASIVLTNLDFFGKTVAGISLSIPIVIGGFIMLCVAGIIVARVVGRLLPIFYKFGKFGEAGGLNWLVDLGIVNLLILVTGYSTGIYFILFKGISFASASTNSYFWNKFWVFRGVKKQSETKEVGKFAIATVLGMLVNIILASSIAFIGPLIFGGISSKSWANIATIVGSLTAMIFNFLLYKIWVFKDR